jgi:hypothetical protein
MEDRTIWTGCDECRKTHGERTPPTIPPCESCWVELKEENKDIASIYMEVRNQVITVGMGEVIDINHLAIWAAINEYKIKDRIGTFKKVCRTFHHFLSKSKKEHNEDI